MKKRVLLLICGVTFALWGCPPPEQAPPLRSPELRPVVVAHMDLAQKKRYLQEVKASMRDMLNSVDDLTRRRKPQAMSLVRARGDEYVAIYVEPILGDAVAGENLDTKFDVAKLYLLTAKFYLRTGAYEQSRGYLKRMASRYAGNAIFMNASLDRADIGYASLQEGFDELRSELATH